MTKILTLTTSILFTAQLLMAQLNMTLDAYVPYADNLNDVWGYVDTAGNEYALVGTVNGTSIVDVTDPSNPNQLFFIPGQHSTWRDLKTWQDHLYVTTEAIEGLLIVDLSKLPDSISTYKFNADSALGSAHNIYIDENGYAYLFGYNNYAHDVPTNERGAMILDLNQNPNVPVVVGSYNNFYCHDGFARGDTLWTAQIYEGDFGVVDVSDKANPVLLATQTTPGRFTHNVWLSDDGNTLFTTDEVSSGYVAAYDVSDIENITELDRYQSSPGRGVIPHNTHVHGNYLVNSYYKDGVNIIDATDPNALVEVGNFDTSPFISADGYAGCWGAYPFLPSGTILATDIEEGLFILTPNYTRACYLTGNITYNTAQGAIQATRVEFVGTDQYTFSDNSGDYLTGIGTPGLYTVRFYKAGCTTQIFTNVDMQSGQTTTLNADMECDLVGIADPDDAMLSLSAQPSVFNSETSILVKNNTGSFDDISIQVFDMNGKLVEQWTSDTPETVVNTGSNWASGTYNIVVSSPQFSQVSRVVKQP